MGLFFKRNTLSPTSIKLISKAMNEGASPRVVSATVNRYINGKISEEDLEKDIENSIYKQDYDFIHDTYSIGKVVGIKNRGIEVKTDKVLKNIIFGVAFGDIVGSIYGFKYFDPNELPDDLKECIEPHSRWTDDTLLTLSTLNVLKKDGDQLDSIYTNWLGNQDFHLGTNPFISFYKQSVRNYPDAGWGWHFAEWGKSDGAEPYKSYGDGAAMRVSLIGAWYSDPDQVVFTAAVSAAASHNHPEGIKGAVVSAACIWMALRGYTKEEICRYLQEHYRHNEYGFAEFSLDEIRTKIPEEKHDSSCMFAVPAAIICFLESESYGDAIRNTCSFYGDTDTIAAIAGGIAAAYYGFPDRFKQIVEEKCVEISHRRGPQPGLPR